MVVGNAVDLEASAEVVSEQEEEYDRSVLTDHMKVNGAAQHVATAARPEEAPLDANGAQLKSSELADQENVDDETWKSGTVAQMDPGWGENHNSEMERPLEEKLEEDAGSLARESEYLEQNEPEISPQESQEMMQQGTPDPEDQKDTEVEATPGTPEALGQLLNCQYCDQGYRCLTSLMEHIKHQHEGEGNFSCYLCGHTVHYYVLLEQHMALHAQHNAGSRQPSSQYPVLDRAGENRKFKCTECGKAFKYKHHLKEHLRIHSGEKPYECPNCKKRFSHSGSYSSHFNSKKCLPAESLSERTRGVTRTSSLPCALSVSRCHSSLSLQSLKDGRLRQYDLQSAKEQPLDYRRKNPSASSLGDTMFMNGNTGSRCLGSSNIALQGHLQNLAMNTVTPLSYLMPGKGSDSLLRFINPALWKRNHCDDTQTVKDFNGKENGHQTYDESRQKRASFGDQVFEIDLEEFSKGNNHCKYCGQTSSDIIALHQHERYLCKLNKDIPVIAEPNLCATGDKQTKEKMFFTASNHNCVVGSTSPTREGTTSSFRTSSGAKLKEHNVTLNSDNETNCFEHTHSRGGPDAQSPTAEDQQMRKCLSVKPSDTSTRASLLSITSPLTDEVLNFDKTQTSVKILQSAVAPVDNGTANERKGAVSPLNFSVCSLKGNPIRLDNSTSEGHQVEPLDLSLPKKVKELRQVPATKNGIRNSSQHLKMEEKLLRLNGYKILEPDPETVLRDYPLYPSSFYSAFTAINSVFPSALINSFHGGLSGFHVNSVLNELNFLPHVTYMYGSDHEPLLMKKYHQENAISMGEIASRGSTDYSSQLDDGTETDFGPGRKRLKKTEDGLYACELCDKTFQKSSSLLRHKYEHTGKRPHQCNICKKAFKHKHHLIEHSRLHSGEKPYQCNKCGKRFSHSGSYSQHMNHRYAYCRKGREDMARGSTKGMLGMEPSPPASEISLQTWGLGECDGNFGDNQCDDQNSSEDLKEGYNERSNEDHIISTDFTKTERHKEITERLSDPVE
nr:PREDICTED: zinc finger E-box-binding homeobox 2-like [Latimeria chalumnae]|eukprot:XP_014348335.1 PREDICTED: zinc finger E-box-binding homeobox 2-like [Latimeria chalumnae]